MAACVIGFGLLLILGSLSSSQAISSHPKLHESVLVDLHEQWISKHGRTYGNDTEKKLRFGIFKDNLKYVENFNKHGNQTYKLGINGFADLTSEEFLNDYTTGILKPNGWVSTTEFNPFKYGSITNVPPSIDWRDYGAVSYVKNQGPCACCWAFSAVAAVEGLIRIKTGYQLQLSEQQLVDCARNGNRGCSGGWMANAFDYIVQNQGVTLNDIYPYQARDGYACPINYQNTGAYSSARISGYQRVPSNNEEALLKAVSRQPVSASLDGSSQDFRMYRSGVFSGGCTTTANHAVTIIGYGTTEDGIKYWLIKNSWGEYWGENGYMRLRRDAGYPQGLCGIANDASYPV